MDRRAFICGVACGVVAVSFAAEAQQAARSPRIGYLSPFPRADAEVFLDQLRPELEKLGWKDGRNIVLMEPRTTEGDNARLSSLAAELVAMSPDLILVQSAPATRALMR